MKPEQGPVPVSSPTHLDSTRPWQPNRGRQKWRQQGMDSKTGEAGGPEGIETSLREAILARPDLILNDPEMMQALVTADEQAKGENIVDLRGVAMERLEARLASLEGTHRSVISAAFENLAGTNQIHRAILRMLDPLEFEPFLRDLGGEVAQILRIDVVRLVLESPSGDSEKLAGRLDGVLSVAEPGFVSAYLAGESEAPLRQVTLRQVVAGDRGVYGEAVQQVCSEACLKLDFGPGRLPGLLVLGSFNPQQFTAQHGTDLLAFFAGVFERAMRRWLS